MKGYTYVEKYSMVIATNSISICCVYKEKIVKNDSYKFKLLKNVASIQIQKVATFDSDRQKSI